MTLIFFLFATLELTIGSWLPTYAIKAGVTDTKGSALFTSLFWITNCVVKVFWVYLPGTVQAKLDISLKLMLLSAVAAWGFQEL
jgi:fucose permease